MISSSDQPRLNARRWQLGVAERWLADRLHPDSDSNKLGVEFSQAVVRTFMSNVGSFKAADEVISHLGPTLTQCDELAFDQDPQALAYLVWHEVDRYHRVIQSLDLLFQHGVLPIAKPGRDLRVLEVGAGPAPASYAAIDYFAVLGEWSHATATGFASSGSVRAETLDRGPAWGRLIHGLSEELMVLSRQGPKAGYGVPSWFFNVTHTELSGFNPRQMHNRSRDDAASRLLESARSDSDEFWDMWVPSSDREEIASAAARMAQPSAYDLIIVANFVTNDRMITTLEADLKTLALSLVPGGVLLTLSAPGKRYQRMWQRFAAIAESCRLDHEIDQVLRAHAERPIHDRVAGATIAALRHLHALAPQSFASAALPSDVRAEVEAALSVPMDSVKLAANHFASYPAFQVHAFKRGQRAIPARDRERIARRRRQ